MVQYNDRMVQKLRRKGCCIRNLALSSDLLQKGFSNQGQLPNGKEVQFSLDSSYSGKHMLGVTDLAPDLWISANIPPCLDQVNSFCRVLAMSQPYGCAALPAQLPLLYV